MPAKAAIPPAQTDRRLSLPIAIGRRNGGVLGTPGSGHRDMPGTGRLAAMRSRLGPIPRHRHGAALNRRVPTGCTCR